jgi:hypothetical protein
VSAQNVTLDAADFFELASGSSVEVVAVSVRQHRRTSMERKRVDVKASVVQHHADRPMHIAAEVLIPNLEHVDLAGCISAGESIDPVASGGLQRLFLVEGPLELRS